jgi:general secretion pathway protein I
MNMSIMRRVKDPNGFTLIEIMIALMVLSVSFVVLIGLRNRDIALAAYSHHMTEATLLARQRITEVSVSGFPDMGESEGNFGETVTRYRWKQQVKQTPFEVVRELVVAVIWNEGSREEEVRFTTYIFNAK